MTTPDLAQIVRVALEAELAEVRVSLPGKIVSYDASLNTADIEIAIKDPLGDGESEDFPLIRCVPVVFPRATVGGWYLHFPLTAGDEGDLIFSDWPIDVWRREGNTRAPVDLRNHSIGGAKFYPGLHSSGNVVSDVEAAGITMGKDGEFKVVINATQMQVGGDSDAAALASKVNTLSSQFEGHTHITTATIGSSATVGVIQSQVGFVHDDVASAVLKVGS